MPPLGRQPPQYALESINHSSYPIHQSASHLSSMRLLCGISSLLSFCSQPPFRDNSAQWQPAQAISIPQSFLQSFWLTFCPKGFLSILDLYCKMSKRINHKLWRLGCICEEDICTWVCGDLGLINVVPFQTWCHNYLIHPHRQRHTRMK